MYNEITETVADAVNCSAMERETISKNRACLKSQRVGFNFIVFTMLAFALSTFVFMSCEKNDEDKNPMSENGVVINGVKWATRNVDAPGIFVAMPENFGMLYQWNKNIGWSNSNPMKNSKGATVWDASISEGATWEKKNDPSPAGWRVPTLDEIESLFDEGKVLREQTTLNGVNGVRFTDRTSGTSIFIPAAGSRENDYGTLDDVGSEAAYWSSTKYDSPYGYKQAYYLLGYSYFNSSTELREYRIELRNADYNYGFSIRCVAE
jgi:uncharacterized protein (TIGR02145 family)